MRGVMVGLGFLLAVAGWGQPRLRLETGIGHTKGLNSAAFSPDGRKILTTSDDRTARLWDVATAKETRQFKGAYSAVFSPDGKSVLTANYDETARLWDIAGGKEARQFAGHGGPVSSAIFSPDGESVLTTSWDHTARLWDMATGKETLRFEGHGGIVNSATFSTDGKRVLTVSDDQTARLWSAESGKEIWRFEGHGVTIWCAVFSPDGKSVLTAGAEGTARLWNVKTGKETLRFEGHGGSFSSAVFSPDGNRVLTVNDDKTTRLWDVATGKETRRFEGNGVTVWSAVCSPDGKKVLTASEDKTACLWDVATGKETRRFRGHLNGVSSAVFSPDGKRVLTSSGDRTARLWDVSSGKETNLFEGHGSTVNSAVFSSDARRILTASDDWKARLWDVEIGNETLMLEGHVASVTSAIYSPDCKSILTSSGDRTARLWDAASGKETRRLEGHGGTVNSAVFSPDGQLILTAGDDQTARLWGAATGKEIRRFEWQGDVFGLATFSPDGKSVFVENDETVRCWDVETGKEIRPPEGHRRALTSATFSPDRKRILDWGRNGITTIWDSAARTEVCSVISYTDHTWAVVDPAGRYDSSDNGHNPNLYWVYEDPAKGILEPIDIDQFASAYYTPGLLARVMRRETLPLVPDLKSPPLFPSVHDVKAEGRTVRFGLTARGGGVGSARVLVDGQEVAQVQGREGKNEVSLPFEVKPGTDVEVIAFNKDNSLSSPRSGNTNAPPPIDVTTPTRYVAVISGINDYQGTLTKLSFAVSDAKDIALSVLACAQGLKITPEIYLLTNDPGAKDLENQGVHVLPATKQILQDVMTKIIPAGGKWRESDELFLYFAGHGTSYTEGNQKHYAYLTQDATSADMRLPEVRAQQAVTDDDIVHWLANFIGGKKAMVIDTCAAGAASTVLEQGTRSEDLDLDRKQAVYETQRRTGIQVLFGCPSDLVSYESPEYGHGLLTWSLLNSLANDSLGTSENKGMVLVKSLFDRASETTQKESGSQRALTFGRGQNFPLGYLDAAGKKAIPFSSKVPLFGMISLNNRDKDLDDLDLAKQIADALAATARSPEKPPARFAPDSPNAIKVQGGYTLIGDKVSLRMNLIRAGQPPITLTIESTKSTVTADAVKKLLDWARSERSKLAPLTLAPWIALLPK